MTFRTQTILIDPADQHVVFMMFSFLLKMAKFGIYTGGYNYREFLIWARGFHSLGAGKRKKRSFKIQDDIDAIDLQTNYTAFIYQVFYFIFFVLCMHRMTWFR